MAARRKKKSKLMTAIWGLMTLVASGGIGGYLDPDLPFLGPMVSQLHLRDVVKTAGLPEDGQELAERFKDLRSGSASSAQDGIPSPGGVVVTPAAAVQRPADKIRIATFNIQVFGESKIGKPDVVDVLAQVVRRFDVVAIQEIRTKKDTLMPRFLEKVNQGGGQYNFLIGPRLGRSVSTEQYVYIYDTTRVEYDPSSVGTMSDPTDLLHREPYVARFRAKTSVPEKGFTFWLVNIHTDPDEVPQEIDVLADVFQVMQTARADEDDVILLGDLNASEKQFGRLGEIPGMSWVVRGDVMTNTRRNRAYDNLLFEQSATAEYTGTWGVLDLEETFGLTRDQALKVSDHLPVWAEFDAREATAGRPKITGRDRLLNR